MSIIMKKSQYWQIVRGVCILAVVMIHCPQGGAAWLGIRQIINFPVALFIFMAGYFVNPKKVDKLWLKNREMRLIIPFLLWSIIYSIKNYIGGASVRSVVFNFITGKAVAPLYYILVLLQLTLLTPYLLKNRKGWMYLVTPVYLIILYIYNIATGDMPKFYETIFPAWFFFYILGMDCRGGKIKAEKFKARWIRTALVLSFVEAFVLIKLGCSVGFACSQIKFSSFLYVALIALLLVKNEKECDKCLLSTIGDCSFGIYFSHIMVMWAVSKVISIDTWFARWSLTFIFTLILSFVFVWLVRKIFEGKKLLRKIGFE